VVVASDTAKEIARVHIAPFAFATVGLVSEVPLGWWVVRRFGYRMLVVRSQSDCME